MTQPTAKQVNQVLRSKRCGPHENKKRKKEESEFMKQVREAIKRSKQRMDDLP